MLEVRMAHSFGATCEEEDPRPFGQRVLHVLERLVCLIHAHVVGVTASR